MTTTSRRAALCLSLAALLLTGCARTIAGHPRPIPDTASSTASLATSPDATVAPSSGPPAITVRTAVPSPQVPSGLDPCKLLPAADVADLWSADAQPDPDLANGQHPACFWTTPTGDLFVVITMGLNLTDLLTDTADRFEDRTIGRYPARLIQSANGSCHIYLAVTPGLLIGTGINLTTPAAPVCDKAEQAALRMQARLPRL